MHERNQECLSLRRDYYQVTGITPLGAAAEGSHAAVVQYLLRTGAVAVDSNVANGTPLYTACSTGNAAIAELLLKAGADPLAADVSGVSPFVRACERQMCSTLELMMNVCPAACQPQLVHQQLMDAVRFQRLRTLSFLLNHAPTGAVVLSKADWTRLLTVSMFSDCALQVLQSVTRHGCDLHDVVDARTALPVVFAVLQDANLAMVATACGDLNPTDFPSVRS